MPSQNTTRDARARLSDTPTVAELDRELIEQAAVAHAAIADEQARSAELRAKLEAAMFEVESLTAELVVVREVLRLARAEVQWLRRAGVDLNAIMEHPAVRTARRAARAVSRRRPTPGGP